MASGAQAQFSGDLDVGESMILMKNLLKDLRRTADIDKILKRMLEYDQGPCVVHCHCEKEDNVYPMIPAGAAVHEMLIEPPKHKLAQPTGST